jgi:RNA polymerase sigma factor (sigma-70 family)
MASDEMAESEDQPDSSREGRPEAVPASVFAAAAHGDEAAFTHVVAAYNDDMLRVCYVITRDANLAADAVQEAWAIAWRQMSGLREPNRLKSWLVAVAANEARQIMRHQRRVLVDDAAVESSASTIGGGSTVWSGRVDLGNALAHLSPEDRALLALRYVADLNSTELSEFTGLTPSGTRARLQHLLSELRDEVRLVNG